MKVVILAGGFGTRLVEETVTTPKPMVHIGDYPIVWHIMKSYASFGHNEFVLALGYKAEVIKNFFLHFSDLASDLVIDLNAGLAERLRRHEEKWKIYLIDTGINTLTGGRVRRLRSIVGNETFMLTYGDGVSDVPIDKVIEHHRKCGKLATVTAVRPPARFGGIVFDGDDIVGFAEKRQIDEGWINGGFMVMEPGVFQYLLRDEDVLEIDLLERLVHDRQLSAYRHEGFWQCMDTLRDKQALEKMWNSGQSPWKRW